LHIQRFENRISDNNSYGESPVRNRLVLITASAVVFFSIGVASATPPERKFAISIKDIDHTLPSVGFDHKGHGEKVRECRTCHHRDTAILGQKCSGCHGNIEGTTNIGLKQAYHKMCLGCHSRKKAGPQKCTRCHTGEDPVLTHIGQR